MVDIHGKKTAGIYEDILGRFVARFVVSEGCRGGCCEKTPGSASILNKVSASCKAHSLLAKAEPISNIHGTSVVYI